MRRSNQEEASRWLKTAKYELESTLDLIKAERYPLACFVAQQSAEKALKAFLYFVGEGLVKGHSAHELCKSAQTHDPSFSEIQSSSSSLDAFYITTRYPDSLPGGTPADIYNLKQAQEAYNMAKGVLDFVLERIRFKNSSD